MQHREFDYYSDEDVSESSLQGPIPWITSAPNPPVARAPPVQIQPIGTQPVLAAVPAGLRPACCPPGGPPLGPGHLLGPPGPPFVPLPIPRLQLSQLKFDSGYYTSLQKKIVEEVQRQVLPSFKASWDHILLARDTFVLLFLWHVTYNPSLSKLWYLCFLLLGSRLRFLFSSAFRVTWRILGLLFQKVEPNFFPNMHSWGRAWCKVLLQDPSVKDEDSTPRELRRAPILSRPSPTDTTLRKVTMKGVQYLINVFPVFARYREVLLCGDWKFKKVWNHYSEAYIGLFIVVVTLPLLMDIFVGLRSTPPLTLSLWGLTFLTWRFLREVYAALNVTQKRMLQAFDSVRQCSNALFEKQQTQPSTWVETTWSRLQDFVPGLSVSVIEVKHVHQILQELNFPEVLQQLIVDLYQGEFVYESWIELPTIPGNVTVLLCNKQRALVFDLASGHELRLEQKTRWKNQQQYFHFLP